MATRRAESSDEKGQVFHRTGGGRKAKKLREMAVDQWQCGELVQCESGVVGAPWLPVGPATATLPAQSRKRTADWEQASFIGAGDLVQSAHVRRVGVSI